jgi:hypothetical protein
MRPLLLPAFLAFTAAVLPPNASIGQDAGFGRDADVHVREDSFACKETSELDRLLQRNQSGGFTSGVQLYEYLQSHNCIGLSAGRVRVYATHGQYVCIYDPKGKNKPIKPCAWTRKDMLSKMNDTVKIRSFRSGLTLAGMRLGQQASAQRRRANCVGFV